MYKSPLWQIAIALVVPFAAYEIVVMFLQALLMLPAGERGARVVKAEPSDGRACAMRSRATEFARRTSRRGHLSEAQQVLLGPAGASRCAVRRGSSAGGWR